jgi:hypothetical protein
MALLEMLLGRRLANREAEQRKITTIDGLPAMPIGAVGLTWIAPITLATLVMLTILAMSYWQTIEAYPFNGGS